MPLRSMIKPLIYCDVSVPWKPVTDSSFFCDDCTLVYWYMSCNLFSYLVHEL